MHTVAFVTRKGGAGKSTLASNIAVAAHLAGERVFVCDLDPLRSLVKWSQARKTLDIPVERIPPEKLPRALEKLEAGGVTLAVIDTPGADARAAEAAIRRADLCVIPARPNVLDLWATEETLAAVRAQGADYAFLLNQCPSAQQGVRIERGAQSLQEMGALLSPLVSSRVHYQDAIRLGLGVMELAPDGAAAREMRKLWKSMSARRRAGAGARPRPAAAAEPYRALLEQAIAVHGFYADFLNALSPFNDARAGAEPEAEAKSARSGRSS